MSRTAAYPQRGQAVRDRRTGAEGTIDAVLDDGTINIVCLAPGPRIAVRRTHGPAVQITETWKDTPR